MSMLKFSEKDNRSSFSGSPCHLWVGDGGEFLCGLRVGGRGIRFSSVFSVAEFD